MRKKRLNHLTLARATEFANGLGTILHHAAASLLIIMLLMGVITPNREVVTPIMFLVMQHWLVLLAHVNTNLYIGLELILEIGFQWSVVSGLERLVADHWTAGMCALTMLMAHELYLMAATIELFFGQSNSTRTQHDPIAVVDLTEKEVSESCGDWCHDKQKGGV